MYFSNDPTKQSRWRKSSCLALFAGVVTFASLIVSSEIYFAIASELQIPVSRSILVGVALVGALFVAAFSFRHSYRAEPADAKSDPGLLDENLPIIN